MMDPYNYTDVDEKNMMTDNERVFIYSFRTDKTIFQYAVSTMVPDWMVFRKGQISIYSAANARSNVLRDYLLCPLNKTLDLIMYFGAYDTPAEEAFSVYYGVKADDEAKFSERRQVHLQLYSTMVMELVMHGTLSRWGIKSARIAKILYSCYEFEPSSITLGMISSLTNLSKVRMDGMLDSFMESLPRFSQAIRNRLLLGVGGNRHWQIIKWMKPQVTLLDSDHQVIHFMFNEDVLSGAPYISYHPQHRMNPMGNHSAWLYAALGEICARSGITIPSDPTNPTGLFPDFVSERMKKGTMLVSNTAWDMQALIDSVDTKYSIPFVLIAAKSAGITASTD
jgi:hypothetical protein